MLNHQRPRRLLSYAFHVKIPCFLSNQRKPLSTLSSLLNLCTKAQQLQQVHARFILHGLHHNPTLSSKLIDCYANLGYLSLSLQVFRSFFNPSSILYDAILRSLAKFYEFDKTLLVYQEMVMKSIYPDEDTYPFLLRACCSLPNVENGKKIHGHIVKLGFYSHDLVRSSLTELYRRCYEKEGEVFDKKSQCNLDYWNSLISEAYHSRNAEESFRLFERMRLKNVEPNSVTAINLLRSSVDLNSLKLGKFVHCLAVVNNLCGDLLMNTALLSMYVKLGALQDAEQLFNKMPEKDSVVWNIMISENSRNGQPKKSLQLLRHMVSSGVRPDLFTAIPAISSISQLKAIEWGKQIHAHVIRNGSDYQVSVYNSLIDMYCECNRLCSAQKIFDMVSKKTQVSWSAMIKGYVTHDQFLDALALFSKMKYDGNRVDFVSVINILPACVNVGALENVKCLHGYSIKVGLDSCPSLNTAIFVSYAKCGCIEIARKLFDEEKTTSKDAIMWNSIINAYAKHGDWHRCFNLYEQMKWLKVKPDHVTFLGLLTACVNSGLVEEGKNCFKEMKETYCFQPNQEHYACMVNLLGRAGHINEAKEFVKTMPFKPDAQIWGPLLSACKMHRDPKVAELAAENLITMEPRNAGNYILLSNIYAAAGKWDKVAKMRSVLRDKGLKKTPGSSWIEINGHVCEFRVADHSHPRSHDIYATLGNFELEIKDAREKSYVDNLSNIDFV